MNSKLGLSPNELSDFFHQGFFIRRGVFSEKEISQISESFDRAQNEAKKFSQTTIHENSQFVVVGDRIDRIVWVCGSEPDLRNYSQDIRITVPSSELLGSKQINQLICQAHFKLPGDQVEFLWHQDSQNRGYGSSEWQDVNGKGSFVQTLLAIDATPIESGPLFFIPRSLDRGHLYLEEPENYKKYIDESKAVPALLNPGDLAFFHPYVIHGSKPNISSRSRRVFINGFAHPGANQRLYPGCGLGEIVDLRNIATTPSTQKFF